VDSACQLPTIWTPIGIPSWLVPNRMETPGRPVTVRGMVADMMPMAFTVWPSISNSVCPCLNDGVGRTGVSNTSYFWKYSAAYLESLLENSARPLDALRRYPETFRWALENENRICLCSFMSAQFDDLPDRVKTEVQAFTDVNLAWLKKVLIAGKVASPKEAEKRARAIYSGIMGAQLMARSQADIALYDSLIESYRAAGLLPA